MSTGDVTPGTAGVSVIVDGRVSNVTEVGVITETLRMLGVMNAFVKRHVCGSCLMWGARGGGGG